MNSAPIHEDACHILATSSWKQRKLTGQDGVLALRPRRQIHPRTPAPHTVRRIANEPVWTSNEPHLTSFLRFPAELRLLIYRLLLVYDGSVEYRICPVTKQILNVNVRSYKRHYPWTRHGLFPAILECCRLIYTEGASVLYGVNKFMVCDCWNWGCPVVRSWPFSQSNFEWVSDMTIEMTHTSSLLASLSTRLAPFLGLRKLTLRYRNLNKGWSSSLAVLSSCLLPAAIAVVEFDIGIEDSYKIYHKLNSMGPRFKSYRAIAGFLVQSMLAAANRVPFEERQLNWGERRLRWRFIDKSDHWGPVWTLRVFVGHRRSSAIRIPRHRKPPATQRQKAS
ncbi:hypothetical protein GQ53DRAFT_15362 [Thozetella sp. PMI_491]|nr:hypothetical protein GQ53DRAFT_15362 [Thozetella sp. PMI_491]